MVIFFSILYVGYANGAGFKSEEELIDETRANIEKHMKEESAPAKASAAKKAPATARAPEVAKVPAAEKIPAAEKVPAAADTPATVKPAPAELVIADFNTGGKPNNIGGDFGVWSKDPADHAQGCTESFDSANRHGDSGSALKLKYSVDSANVAYNGFWMSLQNLDATKYGNLAFWVKGDPKAGYTTVFKVELHNADKETGYYYVTSVADQWQEIVIPLAEFKGITDLKNLTKLVIVFEDKFASNKKGVIYIDDIRFNGSK